MTSQHLKRDAPFDAQGDLGKMHQVFGDQMDALIDEIQGQAPCAKNVPPPKIRSASCRTIRQARSAAGGSRSSEPYGFTRAKRAAASWAMRSRQGMLGSWARRAKVSWQVASVPWCSAICQRRRMSSWTW